MGHWIIFPRHHMEVWCFFCATAMEAMGLSHLELRLLLSYLLFGKAEAWKLTFNFYDFSLHLLSYSSNRMRSLPMKNLEWEVYFEFPSCLLSWFRVLPGLWIRAMPWASPVELGHGPGQMFTHGAQQLCPSFPTAPLQLRPSFLSFNFNVEWYKDKTSR